MIKKIGKILAPMLEFFEKLVRSPARSSQRLKQCTPVASNSLLDSQHCRDRTNLVGLELVYLGEVLVYGIVLQ